MLTAILALAITADSGMLVGLCAEDGSYRTVFVSQRGVAYVNKEHKGDVVVSNKDAVLEYRVDGEDIVHQGRAYHLGGKYLIDWVSRGEVGLATQDTPPVRRTVRLVDEERVVDVRLTDRCDKTELQTIQDAAKVATNDRAAQPSETDWGLVRSQGAWLFTGTVGEGDKKRGFTALADKLSFIPKDGSKIAWRTVTNKYEDATDLLSSRFAPFAVVVTPDYLCVHEATQTSLGRLVRKIPCKNERVVSFEFGGGSPLEAWIEYFKNRPKP